MKFLSCCAVLRKTEPTRAKQHRPVARLKQLRGLSKMVKQKTRPPPPPPVTQIQSDLGVKDATRTSKNPVDLVSKKITLHLDHTLGYMFLPFL